MTRKTTLSTIFAVAALLPAATTAQSIHWKVFAEPFVSIAHAQSIDWKKVDVAFGKPAAVGGVSTATASRERITRDTRRRPDQASTRARRLDRLRADARGRMVMGDLVLLETEITPVMTKLPDNGLGITAVHNHILRATRQHSTYMSPATAIPTRWPQRSARRSRGQQDPVDPPATTAPPPRRSISIPRARPDHGAKGEANGGIYQFGVPRRDPATKTACKSCPALGVPRHQLSADRRRQGGHHRGLPADR